MLSSGPCDFLDLARLSLSSPEPKSHKVSLQDKLELASTKCSNVYPGDQPADCNQTLSEASLWWDTVCIMF